MIITLLYYNTYGLERLLHDHVYTAKGAGLFIRVDEN